MARLVRATQLARVRARMTHAMRVKTGWPAFAGHDILGQGTGPYRKPTRNPAETCLPILAYRTPNRCGSHRKAGPCEEARAHVGRSCNTIENVENAPSKI